jgi:hypothetical protein
MREAIGSSFVLNFVITFIAIFILFFVGSLTYTKAFKVKNKIIDTIESYQGEIASSNSSTLKSDFVSDVDNKLSEIGYRLSNKSECESNGRFSNGTELIKQGTSTYRYCIYQFTTDKGNYYGVTAYMYFEVPIIGVKLEFPVYGETKIFTKLSK